MAHPRAGIAIAIRVSAMGRVRVRVRVEEKAARTPISQCFRSDPWPSHLTPFRSDPWPFTPDPDPYETPPAHYYAWSTVREGVAMLSYNSAYT